MKKELGTFLLLVLLCIVVAILNPRFLAGANLQNMARLVGAYGIFSIGLGIVIITGGIDLSVGSVFALLGVLLSLMLTGRGWPGAVAVVAIVAIAASLGALHGFLITKLNLQPFIVTLCGLLFYRGLARFIANDETMGFGNAAGFERLRDAATGSLFGVPTPFVILVVISVVMWFVLHRSAYGRYLFAVGRNETAARYSGINSRKIIASAYII
ncbi:MAG TPA: ABC transporter permease, partial [Pyrinomonadaceae bacterium]|nr:ABC transporter permease [Pyrinomonadaceae bacterium]